MDTCERGLMSVQLSLIWTHLRQTKVSFLVKCPDFREHKQGHWAAKCVPFVEVLPSCHGVLTKSFHCTCIILYMYAV